MTDPLSYALDWKEKNPDAYAQIVLWAKDDMLRGYRPSIALYVEVLRRPHWAERLGMVRADKNFLIRNDLRSDLARLVMREYPWVVFRTAKSKTDGWGKL